MFAAVNGMMLDALAAVARKDHEDRRRQAEGHAKTSGAYKGHPEDAARNAGIARMLRTDAPWSEIQRVFRCSRSTVARVEHRMPPSETGKHIASGAGP